MNNFGVTAELVTVLLMIIFEKGGTNDLSWFATRDDDGVCKRYHRVTATRRVSFTEMSIVEYDYSDVPEPRTSYRDENYTKWEEVEMCCDGWEPHLQSEEAVRCVPACRSNCDHGSCIAPNTCKCGEGYRAVIDNITKYSYCEPICEGDCSEGFCIGPNHCLCRDGYLNSNDMGSCVADCSAVGAPNHSGCVLNASCVAPNQCQCNVGYIPTPTSNGTSFHLMYHINRTDVVDGNRQTFDITQFRPRFNVSDVICKPFCEPECGNNSNCGAPNSCECEAGYIKVNNTQCHPKCNHSCINGFCALPNTCACHEGYNLHHNVDLLNSSFCEPICHEDCINAMCVAPNHCKCNAGYQRLRVESGKVRNHTNTCVPVCRGNCPNGECVSPGQCHCNAGYVLDFLHDSEKNETQQRCKPLCKPECPYPTFCALPNVCQARNEKSLVGEILGGILLVVIVVAIAVAIHSAIPKISKFKIFRKSRPFGRSETMETSLHSGIDSHL